MKGQMLQVLEAMEVASVRSYSGVRNVDIYTKDGRVDKTI